MVRNIICTCLFLIIFFQTKGQITFQKAFGTPDMEFGKSVVQTFDGGYAFAGSSSYSKTVIIKTNQFGDTVWTRTVSHSIYNYFNSYLCQTFDSCLVILSNSDFPYINPILSKFNLNGDLVWTTGINLQGVFNSVTQTRDSGYVIVGYGDPETLIIVKTDSVGNVIWTKTKELLGGSCAGMYGIESYAGEIIITGEANSEIFIKNFNTGYERSYLGNEGTCIQQTTDSGFVIIGNSSAQILLIKMNSNLQLQWSKSYISSNGSCSGNSCRQTFDGGYIISGTYSDNSTSETDVIVIKSDSTGNIQWSKLVGGPSDQWGFEVQQTLDTGFIIIGMNSDDAYLVKLDSNGNLGCNENNIVLATGSQLIQSFVLGQDSMMNVNNFLPVNTIGGLLHITDPCSLASVKNLIDEESIFSVSPNPFTSFINLYFSTSQNSEFSLAILDLFGRKIFETANAKQNQNLDLSFLTDGFYFLKIKSSEYSLTKKILKSN